MEPFKRIPNIETNTWLLKRMNKIKYLVLTKTKPSRSKRREVRRVSRRSVSGVKDKCVDFCRFTAEYNTFIEPLKGSKFEQNLCVDISLEEIVFKNWVKHSLWR